MSTRLISLLSITQGAFTIVIIIIIIGTISGCVVLAGWLAYLLDTSPARLTDRVAARDQHQRRPAGWCWCCSFTLLFLVRGFACLCLALD